VSNKATSEKDSAECDDSCPCKSPLDQGAYFRSKWRYETVEETTRRRERQNARSPRVGVMPIQLCLDELWRDGDHGRLIPLQGFGESSWKKRMSASKPGTDLLKYNGGRQMSSQLALYRLYATFGSSGDVSEHVEYRSDGPPPSAWTKFLVLQEEAEANTLSISKGEGELRVSWLELGDLDGRLDGWFVGSHDGMHELVDLMNYLCSFTTANERQAVRETRPEPSTYGNYGLFHWEDENDPRRNRAVAEMALNFMQL
jgi:hypothetical protein